MNLLFRRVAITGVTVLLFSLAGCAATTSFTSSAPGSTLILSGQDGVELPRQQKLPSRATGQHEFKVETPKGDIFYGILPLRVNGKKMAASIALFAPALFIGGFRDVFPFYEIDPEARVIRYKSKVEDEWRVYTPTNAEIERARVAFDQH